jgi:hypothetical protein
MKFLPNTHTILEQLVLLERQLQEIKTCEIGRPAYLYHAYRQYTYAYNIDLLKKMIKNCPPQHKMAVTALLHKYETTKID